MFYLTGDRRSKDILEEYAEGLKKFWSPDRARNALALYTMRALVQTYAITWDPALRELAEATTDIFSDNQR